VIIDAPFARRGWGGVAGSRESEYASVVISAMWESLFSIILLLIRVLHNLPALSSGLSAVFGRKRFFAQYPFPRFPGCNIHGVVGSILDTLVEQ